MIESLNAHATEIRISEARLIIHYWGEITGHLDHSVHKHSFIEFCYVTSGEGLYEEEGERLPLRRGTSFVSPPGRWHKISSLSGLDLIWVAFEIRNPDPETDYSEAYFALCKTSIADYSKRDTALISSLWETIRTTRLTETGITPHLTQSIADSLLLSLLHLYSRQEPDARALEERTNGFDSRLMRRAKLYIRDNFGQSIQLKELARYLHVSERHLSRIFKRESGVSFSAYCRSVRIRHAVSLMDSTDLSLKEISERCGFSSVHHFSKVFKHTIRANPSEYKRVFKKSGFQHREGRTKTGDEERSVGKPT